MNNFKIERRNHKTNGTKANHRKPKRMNDALAKSKDYSFITFFGQKKRNMKKLIKERWKKRKENRRRITEMGRGKNKRKYLVINLKKLRLLRFKPKTNVSRMFFVKKK